MGIFERGTLAPPTLFELPPHPLGKRLIDEEDNRTLYDRSGKPAGAITLDLAGVRHAFASDHEIGRGYASSVEAVAAVCQALGRPVR